MCESAVGTAIFITHHTIAKGRRPGSSASMSLRRGRGVWGSSHGHHHQATRWPRPRAAATPRLRAAYGTTAAFSRWRMRGSCGRAASAITIVDDEQFKVRILLREDRGNGLRQKLRAVAGGNDDGEAGHEPLRLGRRNGFIRARPRIGKGLQRFAMQRQACSFGYFAAGKHSGTRSFMCMSMQAAVTSACESLLSKNHGVPQSCSSFSRLVVICESSRFSHSFASILSGWL